jgi:hypothetical protein
MNRTRKKFQPELTCKINSLSIYVQSEEEKKTNRLRLYFQVIFTYENYFVT